MRAHKLPLPGRPLAEELLSSYDKNTAFCYSSPTCSIMCDNTATDVLLPDSKDLSPALELLRGQAKKTDSSALLVGAIPFSANQAPRLMIARAPQITKPYIPQENKSGAQSERSSSRSSYKYAGGGGAEDRRRFVSAAHKIIQKIKEGLLSKVVLARILDLERSDASDPASLVRQMLLNHPGTYNSAIRLNQNRSDVSSLGGNRLFFGASPELLITKNGSRIASNPLAGSAPRSSDPTQDMENAQALLHSTKDRLEHKIVVDDIIQILTPYCSALRAPAQPSLVQTPTMWHLSTRVHGRLKDPSLSSLTLAQTLHPTPAICGQPTPGARKEIESLEPYPRDFFSGFIGWCDAEGNGEWAVAIRCAEASERHIRLYAGAGVVTASDPAQEWLETVAKLKTMLGACGLSYEDLPAIGSLHG